MIMQGLILIYLMINTVTDIRKKEIIRSISHIFFLLFLIMRILQGQTSVFLILTGVLPGLALLLTAWVTKELIGYGDGCVMVNYGIACGIIQTVEVLFWSFLCSAVVSAALLIMKKAGRKDQIPFVPFLLAAHIGIVLCG